MIFFKLYIFIFSSTLYTAQMYKMQHIFLNPVSVWRCVFRLCLSEPVSDRVGNRCVFLSAVPLGHAGDEGWRRRMRWRRNWRKVPAPPPIHTELSVCASAVATLAQRAVLLPGTHRQPIGFQQQLHIPTAGEWMVRKGLNSATSCALLPSSVITARDSVGLYGRRIIWLLHSSQLSEYGVISVSPSAQGSPQDHHLITLERVGWIYDPESCRYFT